MNALARSWSDARGVALVEFALTLPVLLVLGLGGLDTGRYVLANLRCSQIAQTVADNAGRVRHALDETDINEVMIGGKLIGTGIDFKTNGRIILSDLEQRTTPTGSVLRQWIRWQRCAGAFGKTSTYGVPLDASGAAVTNLDSTINIDHGAVQDASTISGMGPTANQIAASANTAVMIVEVFYDFKPISGAFYPFGESTIHVTQAFNIRQRTDFSIYNANKVSGTGRADCRKFDASVPT